MYIFHEHNTSFCLYIKHFHCIRFHLVFRISFTNICLYTLDFYVNHENLVHFKSNHPLFIFQEKTYSNLWKWFTLQFHIIHFDFTRFTKVILNLWQHGMIFYKCLKDKAMNIEINQYSYLSPKIIINKKKPF